MRHNFANSVPIFFFEKKNNISPSLSLSFDFLDCGGDHNFQEVSQGPGLYAIFVIK